MVANPLGRSHAFFSRRPARVGFFVQGRGRAREVDSSFIILSEQAGRSAEQLAAAEQRQLAVAQSLEPTVRGLAELEKELVAQRTRECGARHVLETAQLEEGNGVLSAHSTCTARRPKLICLRQCSRKEMNGSAKSHTSPV